MCRDCEASAGFTGERTSFFAFKPATTHPWRSRRTNVLRKVPVFYEIGCFQRIVGYHIDHALVLTQGLKATLQGLPSSPTPYAQALSRSCSASRGMHQQRGSCTVASAASATADGGAGAGQPAGAALGPIQRLVTFQQAFWKFLRPHTIRGTILGSIAVTARALIESPVVGPPTPSLALTIIPAFVPTDEHSTSSDRPSVEESSHAGYLQQHTTNLHIEGIPENYNVGFSGRLDEKQTASADVLWTPQMGY